MKFFRKIALIAIPAICLGLTSCENSFEKVTNEVAAVQTDLAQRMLDCKTADDAMALLNRIDEATREIDDLRVDIEKRKSDLIQEEKDLTKREMQEIEKLQIELTKSVMLMADGKAHVSKISGVNMEEIGKAMSKLGEALDKLAKVLVEISTEANK